jgi:ABC-type hemin transport system substrate-binding protein
VIAMGDHYQNALEYFLRPMEPLTEAEREKAVLAFDDTLLAAKARLADSVDDLAAEVKAIFPKWMHRFLKKYL